MGKRARDTARVMKPRADKHKKMAKMRGGQQETPTVNEPSPPPPAKMAKVHASDAAAEEPAPSEQRPSVPECDSLVELDEGRLMSRLLYTNPVCLLSTCIPEVVAKALEGVTWKRNVMVVSWLSPCNNEGMFVMCINKRRLSSDCLLARKTFALSVPVKGQEQVVLAVGNESGKKGDKFKGGIPGLASVKIGAGRVGGGPGKSPKKRMSGGEAGNPFALLGEEGGGEDGEGGEVKAEVLEETAVGGCAAHIQASVLSHSELDDKHWLVRAQVDRAFVHPKYWNGKHFLPVDASVPPYMTFLGATRFGYVHA